MVTLLAALITRLAVLSFLFYGDLWLADPQCTLLPGGVSCAPGLGSSGDALQMFKFGALGQPWVPVELCDS